MTNKSEWQRTIDDIFAGKRAIEEIATTENYGRVKLDGVTIVTDADGKIKVADDFVMSDIEIADVVDLQEKLDDVKIYTDDEIADLSSEIEDNFTKIGHTHEIVDVNGLQTVLDSKVELPISANDVTDTTSRVMISPQQRGQIDANASDINTHSQRLATLESEIGNLNGSDEKVKMNANDNSGYLDEKLDNTTLISRDDKVVAVSLDGLVATISELNLLTGATSNIQSQINALSNVGNFTTSVPTYADLANLSPSVNDMVIVISDENENDTPSTIYIYNGTDWVYSGKFEGGQIRDFVANPISLESEVAGILPKILYEKQDASETPFVDPSGNIISSNTQDAIRELFQFADSGKRAIANAIGYPVLTSDDFNTIVSKYQILLTDIASAITAKGVATYPYNKLNELPSRISAIPNITLEGQVEKISKVNITAPYELRVPLTADLSISDVTSTMLEFEEGDSGVVHYEVNFDNGDASDFVDNDNVEFDGVMKLRNNLQIDMNRENSWSEEGNLYRKTIVKDDWISLNKVNVVKKKVVE